MNFIWQSNTINVFDITFFLGGILNIGLKMKFDWMQVWVALGTNIAATFLGAFFGVITAFYFEKRTAKKEIKAQEETRRQQLYLSFRSVHKSLSLNLLRLNEIIEFMSKEGHGFHVGFDIYTWDAVKTIILRFHLDEYIQDLQDAIVLLYSQLSTYEKTYVNTFWFVCNVAPYANSDSDISTETRNMLLFRAKELKSAVELMIGEITIILEKEKRK